MSTLSVSETLEQLLAERRAVTARIKEIGQYRSALYVRGLHTEMRAAGAESDALKARLREIDKQVNSYNRTLRANRGSAGMVLFMRSFYQAAREMLPEDTFKNIRIAADQKIGAIR